MDGPVDDPFLIRDKPSNANRASTIVSSPVLTTSNSTPPVTAVDEWQVPRAGARELVDAHRVLSGSGSTRLSPGAVLRSSTVPSAVSSRPCAMFRPRRRSAGRRPAGRCPRPGDGLGTRRRGPPPFPVVRRDWWTLAKHSWNPPILHRHRPRRRSHFCWMQQRRPDNKGWSSAGFGYALWNGR